MMTVTFKNVDQGDSIILQWEQNGNEKVGIVDCNLKEDKTNPVLEFVIAKKYLEIEFIILSHPHFDHYSGLSELLSYCYEKRISIRYFIHTCSQLFSYLKAAKIFLKKSLRSVVAQNELIRLFLKVKQLRDERGLTEGVVSVYPFRLPLNDNLTLTFLAPSSKETDAHLAREKILPEEENNLNHPNANWLSTIIMVYGEGWYVLLTSDAQKSTFQRVTTKFQKLMEKTMYLGQSPHHGASKNLQKTFWQDKVRLKNTPIAISVGTNHFGHPASEVIHFFTDNGYKIFSTNQVGALEEVDDDLDEIKTLLDVISEKSEQADSSVDLSFLIQKEEVFLIQNGQIIAISNVKD